MEGLKMALNKAQIENENERSEIFELLKINLNSQQKLTEDFSKGCTIWLILIGLMINFVYGNNIQSSQYIISIFGIILALAAMWANFMAGSVRDKLNEDIDRLYDILKVYKVFYSSIKLKHALKLCYLVDILIILVFLARFLY
jgi:hypothetical protein